ncbi:MAG: TRC40/GET3/ArsA family transport-energizing ATPase [archaeon]|nr:TRC40/GET3/ArsA family transport-energizing ATPase [archaeon]MCP8313451.1 TRC40/GET3/ArsA family transport-energizing ATPase [archaeon]
MRVILYTGKGGTGKSVIACATGLKTASIGYETLIISSDPAHTLGDALEKRITDLPTKVSESLWATQIDPIKEMQKNYAVIQEWLTSLLSAKGIEETLAYEIASLPGMTHLFALLKIEELAAKEKQFDVIILDTVPSGEALRYLYFPKLFGSISRKLISLVGSIAGIARAIEPIIGLPMPKKEVFKSEVELIKRLEKLGDILKDADTTSLRLIANPDAFSIENTRRTLMLSSLHGINVDLAIINKVMPEKVSDPYFSKWIELQKKCLSEAEASFYPLPIKKLMLFDSELKGIEMLKRSGDELFSNEDPTKVYFKGSLFKIVSKEKELTLIVRVPFTSKEGINDVERIGDELLVKVSTEVGDVVKVIPLPTATLRMKLSRAKLLSDELHISFVDDYERKGEGY